MMQIGKHIQRLEHAQVAANWQRVKKHTELLDVDIDTDNGMGMNLDACYGIPNSQKDTINTYSFVHVGHMKYEQQYETMLTQMNLKLFKIVLLTWKKRTAPPTERSLVMMKVTGKAKAKATHLMITSVISDSDSDCSGSGGYGSY